MTSRRPPIRNPGKQLPERRRAVRGATVESRTATASRLLREEGRREARLARFRRYATWTEHDAREFEAALRAQRVVDPDDWGVGR